MHYRQGNTKGGTYFFTVNLAERHSTLLVDNITALRGAFKKVMHDYPFVIDAVVILPEHCHAIWTLPKEDSDFSTRWRLIKFNFSQSLPKTERINVSRQHKSERGIWQRRFWEHQIRDDLDYIRHKDYVYYNPIKHGYVNRLIDWPYSSFHRDVKEGIYNKGWGDNVALDLSVGEAIR